MTRICNIPGCPNIAAPGTGRCPTHAQAPWRAGSSTRKQTLPDDWGARRTAVLARDGGRCRCPGCPKCDGGPCQRAGTDTDHRDQTRRTDHSLSNLVTLCKNCHSWKSSSEGGKAPRKWT